MIRAKIRVMMAILNICPMTRMVLVVPEAIPKCFLSTELIMALTLGEENKAKPVPVNNRKTH